MADEMPDCIVEYGRAIRALHEAIAAETPYRDALVAATDITRKAQERLCRAEAAANEWFSAMKTASVEEASNG